MCHKVPENGLSWNSVTIALCMALARHTLSRGIRYSRDSRHRFLRCFSCIQHSGHISSETEPVPPRSAPVILRQCRAKYFVFQLDFIFWLCILVCFCKRKLIEHEVIALFGRYWHWALELLAFSRNQFSNGITIAAFVLLLLRYFTVRMPATKFTLLQRIFKFKTIKKKRTHNLLWLAMCIKKSLHASASYVYSAPDPSETNKSNLNVYWIVFHFCIKGLLRFIVESNM